MAARPNTLRTLEYGNRIAVNQLQRLNDMIAMAERVLAENKTLTPEDVANYKACIATAKKQITQFTKIAEIALPAIQASAPRKRGRPSQSELETLAKARGEKRTAAKTTAKPAAAPKATVKVAAKAPVEAPKRRGRPPKAAVAAAPVAEAPKRRGRPPKAAVAAPVQTEAPKRRGRPPKAKPEVNAAPISDAPKTPKRPKAIQAAETAVEPLVANGKNTEIISVN